MPSSLVSSPSLVSIQNNFSQENRIGIELNPTQRALVLKSVFPIGGYTFIASKSKIPFNLPLFIQNLTQEFEKKGISFPHFYLTGSSVTEAIREREKLEGDIDFLGEICAEQINPDEIKSLILQVLQDTLGIKSIRNPHSITFILSANEYGKYDTKHCSLFVSTVFEMPGEQILRGLLKRDTFVFISLPVQAEGRETTLDLRLQWGGSSNPSCITSADCIRCDLLKPILERQQPHQVSSLQFTAAPGYETHEALSDFHQGRFKVNAAAIPLIWEGLRAYARFPTKGFVPTNYNDEKLFVAAWATKWAGRWVAQDPSDREPSYFGELQKYTALHYPKVMDAMVYLTNLRAIFAAHLPLEERDAFLELFDQKAVEYLNSKVRPFGWDFGFLRALLFWIHFPTESNRFRKNEISGDAPVRYHFPIASSFCLFTPPPLGELFRLFIYRKEAQFIYRKEIRENILTEHFRLLGYKNGSEGFNALAALLERNLPFLGDLLIYLYEPNPHNEECLSRIVSALPYVRGDLIQQLIHLLEINRKFNDIVEIIKQLPQKAETLCDELQLSKVRIFELYPAAFFSCVLESPLGNTWNTERALTSAFTKLCEGAQSRAAIKATFILGQKLRTFKILSPHDAFQLMEQMCIKNRPQNSIFLITLYLGYRQFNKEKSLALLPYLPRHPQNWETCLKFFSAYVQADPSFAVEIATSEYFSVEEKWQFASLALNGTFNFDLFDQLHRAGYASIAMLKSLIDQPDLSEELLIKILQRIEQAQRGNPDPIAALNLLPSWPHLKKAPAAVWKIFQRAAGRTVRENLQIDPLLVESLFQPPQKPKALLQALLSLWASEQKTLRDWFAIFHLIQGGQAATEPDEATISQLFLALIEEYGWMNELNTLLPQYKGAQKECEVYLQARLDPKDMKGEALIRALESGPYSTSRSRYEEIISQCWASEEIKKNKGLKNRLIDALSKFPQILEQEANQKALTAFIQYQVQIDLPFVNQFFLKPLTDEALRMAASVSLIDLLTKKPPKTTYPDLSKAFSWLLNGSTPQNREAWEKFWLDRVENWGNDLPAYLNRLQPEEKEKALGRILDKLMGKEKKNQELLLFWIRHAIEAGELSEKGLLYIEGLANQKAGMDPMLGLIEWMISRKRSSETIRRLSLKLAPLVKSGHANRIWSLIPLEKSPLNDEEKEQLLGALYAYKFNAFLPAILQLPNLQMAKKFISLVYYFHGAKEPRLQKFQDALQSLPSLELHLQAELQAQPLEPDLLLTLLEKSQWLDPFYHILCEKALRSKNEKVCSYVEKNLEQIVERCIKGPNASAEMLSALEVFAASRAVQNYPLFEKLLNADIIRPLAVWQAVKKLKLKEGVLVKIAIACVKKEKLGEIVEYLHSQSSSTNQEVIELLQRVPPALKLPSIKAPVEDEMGASLLKFDQLLIQMNGDYKNKEVLEAWENLSKKLAEKTVSINFPKVNSQWYIIHLRNLLQNKAILNNYNIVPFFVHLNDKDFFEVISLLSKILIEIKELPEDEISNVLAIMIAFLCMRPLQPLNYSDCFALINAFIESGNISINNKFLVVSSMHNVFLKAFCSDDFAEKEKGALISLYIDSYIKLYSQLSDKKIDFTSLIKQLIIFRPATEEIDKDQSLQTVVFYSALSFVEMLSLLRPPADIWKKLLEFVKAIEGVKIFKTQQQLEQFINCCAPFVTLIKFNEFILLKQSLVTHNFADSDSKDPTIQNWAQAIPTGSDFTLFDTLITASGEPFDYGDNRISVEWQKLFGKSSLQTSPPSSKVTLKLRDPLSFNWFYNYAEKILKAGTYLPMWFVDALFLHMPEEKKWPFFQMAFQNYLNLVSLVRKEGGKEFVTRQLVGNSDEIGSFWETMGTLKALTGKESSYYLEMFNRCVKVGILDRKGVLSCLGFLLNNFKRSLSEQLPEVATSESTARIEKILETGKKIVTWVLSKVNIRDKISATLLMKNNESTVGDLVVTCVEEQLKILHFLGGPNPNEAMKRKKAEGFLTCIDLVKNQQNLFADSVKLCHFIDSWREFITNKDQFIAAFIFVYDLMNKSGFNAEKEAFSILSHYGFNQILVMDSWKIQATPDILVQFFRTKGIDGCFYHKLIDYPKIIELAAKYFCLDSKHPRSDALLEMIFECLRLGIAEKNSMAVFGLNSLAQLNIIDHFDFKNNTHVEYAHCYTNWTRCLRKGSLF